jgi:tetratricopeptide (TPR) repeat protein
MRISDIRNTQLFQDLCQTLFAAEYPDIEIPDDSSGDEGNDGYIPSQRRLFAIYCPEKYPPPDEYYERKIRDDLAKAVKLRDERSYEIDEWIFATPGPLPMKVLNYLKEKVKEAGISKTVNWSEKHLMPILLRHRELEPLFPDLFSADIRGDMRAGFTKIELELRAGFDALSAEKSQFDEVRQKLDSRIANEYERRFKAAKSLFEQGLFEQAKTSSETILMELQQDTDAPDPALRARACTNIAVCAWHLDDVAEVIKWFEEAYRYTPDDPKCIANLATAQMYRGETSEALATVERAIEADPKNVDAVRTKANILVKEERYDELSSFLEGKGEKDLRMFFSAVHLGAQQRHEDAAQVLSELLRNDPTNITYLERVAADILMGVRYKIEREHRLPWQMTAEMMQAVEEAEGYLTRELEQLSDTEAWQKQIGAYVNRSAARLMLGRSKEALEDCREIIRIDPQNTNAYLNKSKAEMELGDHAAAAQSLERYAELGGDISAQARDLLYSYYATGQSDKAKTFIKKEFDRKWREDDLSVVSLAVLILDLSQDYESAAELVRRAEETFPEHSATFTIRARYEQDTGGTGVEDLLKKAFESATPARKQLATLDLADYYYGQGRYGDALPLFEKLISEHEFTPANYRYLVCLYYTGKFSEVIKFAAKMRVAEEIDPHISPIEALAYKALGRLREAAGIFLALYQRESSTIDYLVEYGICLYRLGEEQNALRAFDQARNRASDIKELLALARGYGSVNQYVTAIRLAYDALQQSPNDPRVHRIYITLVLNMNKGDGMILGEKYAKAFQESIAAFNSRFPEERDIKLVDVSEGFSDVFEMIDRNTAATETIMDLYRKRSLSVSTVAVLKNVSLYDIWLGLQAYGEAGLRVKLGNAEEEEREAVAVTKGKEVVIDLLAFFTIERMGQLSLLRKMLDHIIVHQTVFDEIQAIIQNESRTVERGGRFSLIKVGDQYVKSEIPPENIQRGIESLERIRDFVKNECEITGFERELSESDAELLEAVDLATGAPALLAEQRGLPLLSDDGLLRYRLHVERGIEGFSTYALFTHAVKKRLLARTKLYDLTMQLMRMNYRFIPADAMCLLYAADRDGYRGGGNFENALMMLGGSETNTESLAGVTAEFLANLWGRPLPIMLKVLVLKRVLKAVTQKHPPEELIEKMLDYIYKMTLKALPLYRHLFDEVQRWADVVYPGKNLTLKKGTKSR